MNFGFHPDRDDGGRTLILTLIMALIVTLTFTPIPSVISNPTPTPNLTLPLIRRKVSCELHADTGGYQESKIDLGFNYRLDFHTYRLKYRPGVVSWWVDGHCIHAMHHNLTHPMHTSLILRTNKRGAMPPALMEFAYFTYTPLHLLRRTSEPRTARPQPNQPLGVLAIEELVEWHRANPHW